MVGTSVLHLGFLTKCMSADASAICYIRVGKKEGFLEERRKCVSVETDVGGGRLLPATVAVRHSGMLLQDKERGPLSRCAGHH